MTARVIVYSHERCAPCRAVKAWLSQNRVSYTLKDVRRDDVALREFLETGLLLPPLVVIDSEIVQGFQPDRMEELLLAAEERERQAGG